jgi:hypothetical protein
MGPSVSIVTESAQSGAGGTGTGGTAGCNPTAPCYGCNDILTSQTQCEIGQDGERMCAGSLALLGALSACACGVQPQCYPECNDNTCTGAPMSGPCDACVRARCANEFQACAAV